MTVDTEQTRRHERDYIERTIATVRNHRDADNCWPRWANIFADEIEGLWVELEQAERERANERMHTQEWADRALQAEAQLAKVPALVLVAEAVVNGEWEAAREIADAALREQEQKP